MKINHFMAAALFLSGYDAPLACLTFNQVYAYRYVRQDERNA